jgi:ElaB/YqjD/DUF883 family membrane-anchored ribosome-binding protein
MKYLSVICCATLSLILSACSEAEKKTESKLESIQSEAATAYRKAVEMSKEKWNELRSFTSDEWEQTGKSIVELKDKLAAKGGKLQGQSQEKVNRLMGEVETLQKEAERRLVTFQESSGEKADEAKAALDRTWKELQEKVESLRRELGS